LFKPTGLLNIVPVKEAAAQIISNLRRRHAIVFLPPIYYYIQVEALEKSLPKWRNIRCSNMGKDYVIPANIIIGY
jgi:hypothetical protein